MPVLEIESGLTIIESVSICKYLEKKYKRVNLFGNTVDSEIEIDMWLQKIEERLYVPVIEYGHHTSPFFTGSKVQFPDYADYCKASIDEWLSILNRALQSKDSVCSCGYSFVDITLYIGINLALLWELDPFERRENILSWYQRMHARESAKRVCYIG